MTPPRDTPGPRDKAGGDFVLQEETPVPTAAQREAAAELADGSDVHNVDELGRQLADTSIEDMLRAYLADDKDVPSLPPAPRPPRRA